MIYRIPLISLTAIALLSTTPLARLAADTGADPKLAKSSGATVTIESGDLQLGNISTLSFDNINLNSVTKDSVATSLNTDSQPKLTVEDYRGTHAGWQLYVSMSKLHKKSSESKPDSTDDLPATLALTSKPTTGNTPTEDFSTTISSGEPNAQLRFWQAAPKNGEGNNTVTFTAGKLTINDPYSKISAGEYTATLNWNLESGQQQLATAH